MKQVEPLGGRILAGRHIALEPLEQRHRAELVEAASDPTIWTYMPVDGSKGFAARFDWFTGEMAKGTQVTYVVRRLADGAVAGSSSYLAIAPEHAKVEIGWTWYVAAARATAVNPEAKYLLLGNAFAANYNRVEFKTDSRNARSRAALLKLGAKEEGILRAHMWMPQGYFRDSVYFSILAAEWPQVKSGLERRVASWN